MRIDGQNRSDNFEDRGIGSGGARPAGGLPIWLLLLVIRKLGFKGSLIVGLICAAGYFFMPPSVRQLLIGQLAGGAQNSATRQPGSSSACDLSVDNQRACDFSRVVLGSTEQVWRQQFQTADLPNYGPRPPSYRDPTLVVFAQSVSTGGCGSATSASGPFYCPADQKLYIDPGFYQVLAERLKAPGDFAQAYVIAHEVGHHVQNLIGSTKQRVPGDTENQASVRVELQADCLAGVWGHSARTQLEITEEDLGEALGAAHAIGDDALGHQDSAEQTHGTSAQRMRWFRRGFDSGDAKLCDTFSVTRAKL